MSISHELKQAIRERAKYICEYCHSPERLSANRFTVDHVIPKSGVADLRYESSFVGFLKPRPKLTFGWVQGCHSYLDSATMGRL
ncbi:MAG: HNH endonuclease [Microcystis aeruginosa G13-05]|nr:HNH endonuclease [Microcystis aeruginosa G13-05]